MVMTEIHRWLHLSAEHFHEIGKFGIDFADGHYGFTHFGPDQFGVALAQPAHLLGKGAFGRAEARGQTRIGFPGVRGDQMRFEVFEYSPG